MLCDALSQLVDALIFIMAVAHVVISSTEARPCFDWKLDVMCFRFFSLKLHFFFQHHKLVLVQIVKEYQAW